MRYIVALGLLLGLAVAFPHTAALAAIPLGALARWLVVQPLLWAFATGIVARPAIVRRLPRRLR